MYETNTDNTYQEYKKFNNALFVPTLLGITKLLAILVIIGLVWLIAFQDVFVLVLSVILCVICIPYLWLVRNIQVKRIYKSEKANDTKYKMTFDKDIIKVKSRKADITIEYKDIYKIIETKTNFYIMLSINRGFNVIKANCSKELIDFIKKLNQSKKR